MYFLFSGEGPTDIGVCQSGNACESESFDFGPMVVITDQIAEPRLGHSFLELGLFGNVSKSVLSKKLRGDLSPPPKSLRLPGAKRPRETRYYFETARALGQTAKEIQKARSDDVIAVLFRDSDGVSNDRVSLWRDKWNSMLEGFRAAEFEFGVPMIPKPKSEAWFICALKVNAYQGCDKLEDESGNDNAPDSLKDQFTVIHGHSPLRVELNEIVSGRRLNVDKLEMPSFRAFYERLLEVIRSIIGGKPDL